MSDYVFSFANYEILCRHILETKRLCDYRDVESGRCKDFILLRHDVEFSPKRAYDLGLIENKVGIFSSFFFQITNNAYNVMAHRNATYLKELIEMGHHIGLHFHLNGMTDIHAITEKIKYEMELMARIVGQPIDRFSFHRPTPKLLAENLEIDGIINAYGSNFFTHYSGDNTLPENAIKYVSDSQHIWQYIAPFKYPSKEFFEQNKQIQILCHPYSWTETGYDILNNLRTLTEEKRKEFIETMNSETRYVKDYVNEI